MPERFAPLFRHAQTHPRFRNTALLASLFPARCAGRERLGDPPKRAGYPYLCLYSVDNGPSHFLASIPTPNALLTRTIANGIRTRSAPTSHARWKFVYFTNRIPSSGESLRPAAERLLAPIFEEAGVDVVCSPAQPCTIIKRRNICAPGGRKNASPTVEASRCRSWSVHVAEKFEGAKRTIPARRHLTSLTGGRRRRAVYR